MSKTAMLVERIDKMTSAMQLMATMLGTRLNHNQLAERLGIHRNTLRQKVKDYGIEEPSGFSLT